MEVRVGNSSGNPPPLPGGAVVVPPGRRPSSSSSSFQSLLMEEYLEAMGMGGGDGGGSGQLPFCDKNNDCNGTIGNSSPCSATAEGGNEASTSKRVITEEAKLEGPSLEVKMCSEESSSTVTDSLEQPSLEELATDGDKEKVVSSEDLKVKYNLKDLVVKIVRLSSEVTSGKTVIITKDNQIRFLEEYEDSEEETDDEVENCDTSSDDDDQEDSTIPEPILFPPPSFCFPPPPFAMDDHPRKYYPPGFLATNIQYQSWGTSFFLHMNRYQPEVEQEAFTFTIPNYVPSAPQMIPPPQVSNLKSSRSSSTLKTKSTAYKIPINQRGRRVQKNSRQKKKIIVRDNGRNGERWPCEHCDKTFLYKWNMETHLLRHTGEKPYPCELCDDRFIDINSLIRHIASNHPYDADNEEDHSQEMEGLSPPTLHGGTSNEENSCAFCGEMFKGHQLLKTHIRNEHKDKIRRKLGKRGRKPRGRNR